MAFRARNIRHTFSTARRNLKLDFLFARTSILYFSWNSCVKWSNKTSSKFLPPKSLSQANDKIFNCPFLNATTATWRKDCAKNWLNKALLPSNNQHLYQGIVNNAGHTKAKARWELTILKGISITTELTAWRLRKISTEVGKQKEKLFHIKAGWLSPAINYLAVDIAVWKQEKVQLLFCFRFISASHLIWVLS